MGDSSQEVLMFICLRCGKKLWDDQTLMSGEKLQDLIPQASKDGRINEKIFC